MAEERIQLTREGYETILRELEEARARVERATGRMADMHNAPDDQNQFHEEAAEFDIKTTQERFNERVRHLEFILSRAQIIEEDPDPARVNIGDRVVVWDFEAEQERTFEIVSSEESIQTQQGLSADSPVGQALLGRRIGDVVDVEVPDGTARYSIRRMESVQDTEA
jgi:transcription elongation factor GreA